MTQAIEQLPPQIAKQFDRLPPSNVDAERCVIASMMLCGEDRALFEEIRQIVTAGDFYQQDHAIYFRTLCAMKDAGKPIDAITTRAELIRAGEFEDAGGKDFLVQIMDTVPDPNRGAYYAKLVREQSALRELLAVANATIRRIYEPLDEDSASVIGQEASAAIARTLNEGKSDAFCTAEDALMAANDQIEKGGAELIPTGFRDLDKEIGGIGVGEMMIIGARPSMGKSTIARQIAMRVASHGYPVALVSLEESRSKIGRNWLSASASIDNNRLRRADSLQPDEWARLHKGATKMAPAPVYIVDRIFRMNAIKSTAAYLVAKFGVRLVIVDYLQKVQCEGKDRFEKVTNSSQELSGLWKELNVAGLVLAQLKREVEARQDKRPSMSDLRESGQIEQDADAILFLHREDYYGVSDPSYVVTGDAELIIAKMRDGERGKTVTLKSELNYQRFADKAQEPIPSFD